MAARDTRFLQMHGRQWRVVVPVPRALIAAVGLKHLKQGLKTDSLTVAQVKRWAVVAKLKQEIDARAANAASANDNPLLKEALEWQEIVKVNEWLDRRGELDPEIETQLRTVIEMRTNKVETEHGKLRALEFTGIATGQATPLLLQFDRWLNESGRKERTKVEDRYALKLLADWATKGGWPQTVEGITRRVAADFVSECFITNGVHHRTTKKRLSSLSSYWTWLGLKGLTGLAPGENPWTRQPLPKPARHTEAGKRPFTDDEIGRLLFAGKPEPLLSDFMMVAALSGMREDEIAYLTIADCANGIFRVRNAKTKSGDRTVPIHSKLKDVVARRRNGKAERDWLFHELPGNGNGRRRYMPVSKRFLRYRVGLGVDEKVDGQRQSNVDFHSFRRWFCEQAEQAGIPETTTAAVVGHKRKGMSYGRYSPGPSLEQRRACVEAVKPPKSTTTSGCPLGKEVGTRRHTLNV